MSGSPVMNVEKVGGLSRYDWSRVRSSESRQRRRALSHASSLVRSGNARRTSCIVTARMTQRFARHSSILSTAIYTHSTDEELVRSVQELPC